MITQAAAALAKATTAAQVLNRFPVFRLMRLKPTFSRSDEAG
jgi:hypothetical protein